MTCAYEAPGRLVEGHTAPEPQEHWRGPNGHTLLSWEVDFGDGGSSRLRVRSPEGCEYSIEAALLEIVEPERVVFSSNVGLDGAALPTAGTVTFRRT